MEKYEFSMGVRVTPREPLTEPFNWALELYIHKNYRAMNLYSYGYRKTR